MSSHENALIDQIERATEHRHHQDRDQHVGDRVHHVDDTHHHRIDAAAQIAGGGAIRHADQPRHERAEQTHFQRHASALQRAREQVAAEFVGAEPVHVRERRREADRTPVAVDRIVRQEPRTGHAGNHDQQQDDETGKRRAIAHEA
jgi:hypothetical protein